VVQTFRPFDPDVLLERLPGSSTPRVEKFGLARAHRSYERYTDCDTQRRLRIERAVRAAEEPLFFPKRNGTSRKWLRLLRKNIADNLGNVA
jgi:hypothetical protein